MTEDKDNEELEEASTAIDDCIGEMREMQDRAAADLWGTEEE